MKTDELQLRTRDFALRIVKMFKALPKTTEAQVLGKQLLRSGTSVAANYRAVCRARSKNEFVARLAVVVEEIDESVLWLDLLVAAGIVPEAKLASLTKEAGELLAIFVASQLTVRGIRKSVSSI
ncbi:MAG TPA: four helix bundle protein [Candidatus Acidoferrales bacterium]|nr:four helix bundle protein [Candidatus Acidoferrales bacterium]